MNKQELIGAIEAKEMELDVLQSSLVGIIENLNDSDLIQLNNEYCNTCYYSGYIYDMSEFDDALSFKSPSDLLRVLDSNFSIYDDYFYEDSCGEICSTSNVSDAIDADDIADWLDNGDDWGVDELCEYWEQYNAIQDEIDEMNEELEDCDEDDDDE